MSREQIGSPKTLQGVSRIQSIDFLRGVVMILMALDHVRDYFHAQAYFFNPLDLTQTDAPIFMTRWITHFCAPVFVFLAGTSAFLVGERKGKDELSIFLLTRGIWLIVLEFTVINFSWFFNINFSFIALTVIWALAVGMIILSFMIRLPFKAILATGLLIVFGHNLLDFYRVEGNGLWAYTWSLIHQVNILQIGRFTVLGVYSILPWAGIMIVGYCFGKLYSAGTNAAFRRKTLLQLGVGSLVLFVVLRAINIYGDPSPWQVQESGIKTVLSFINVTKYHPSLFYVLLMLGPSMLLLASTERIKGKVESWIVALGRVPMFYYIVHLYVIHLLALVAAVATGYSVDSMVFNTWVTDSSNLKGYGFSLGVVYLLWIATVAALFPICLWYDRYKLANRQKWWLSYL